MAGRNGERGSGPISAWIGFTVFLALLMLAVQVMYNLYATSVVTAVTTDAARRVAAAAGGRESVGTVEADARRELGGYGERVSFDWSASDDDFVVVRVRARNPRFLWSALDRPFAFDAIDRTIRVRVERFR